MEQGEDAPNVEVAATSADGWYDGHGRASANVADEANASTRPKSTSTTAAVFATASATSVAVTATTASSYASTIHAIAEFYTRPVPERLEHTASRSRSIAATERIHCTEQEEHE